MNRGFPAKPPVRSSGALEETPKKPSVTITQEHYDELLESNRILLALQGAGVDNWEGYEYALELAEANG